MNIFLAASAEDKLGKEFLQVLTIPFKLPWAATGVPALQDSVTSTQDSARGPSAQETPKDERHVSGTRRNSLAGAHLATKPRSPFLPPQQADMSTGGRAHHTFDCSPNCCSRAARTQPTGQTEGVRSATA